jgi:hypothetical protein
VKEDKQEGHAGEDDGDNPRVVTDPLAEVGLLVSHGYHPTLDPWAEHSATLANYVLRCPPPESHPSVTLSGMRRLADGRGIVAISPTSAGILAGEVDLSEWSDEELARGQRRDKHGRWSGRPPKVIPSEVHAEIVRRKMSEAYTLLRENTYKAVEVLVEVATDKKASPAVRVQAAEQILDRTLGKAVEHMKLDVDVMAPWQRLIANSIVGMRGGRLLGIVGTEEQARELEAEEGEVLVAETSDHDGDPTETGPLTSDDS